MSEIGMGEAPIPPDIVENLFIREEDSGFIVFIAFLGAFVPLSTDAYLPVFPQMVQHPNTTAGMINLTLVQPDIYGRFIDDTFRIIISLTVIV